MSSKISALPNASALGGTEQLAGVQSGGNVNITPTQIKSLVCNGQLPFPATQNASADANTLDDYEEGTFTPTLGDGTNNYTLTTAVGFYTKIGNICSCWVSTVWSSIGSAGASQLRLGGLPFTPSGTDLEVGFSFANFDGLDTTATLNPIVGLAVGASANVFFRRVADNAVSVILPANSSSATGRIDGSLVYRTA